ncbi:hypothetical protein HF086_011390 [Spodoptera exigua]|uniref:BESS domain-containing protein n=1 Tax=Spodoptera exigua TaxID=7107 RepID=A0A922N099_SPOEX|nr:hypothetical protein HF086_011390 [Spodoptera exigua]
MIPKAFSTTRRALDSRIEFLQMVSSNVCLVQKLDLLILHMVFWLCRDCGSSSEPDNREQTIPEQGISGQSISEPGTSEQGTREQNTNTIKPRKEKRANKRTYQESEYDAENQMIEEALEVMRRQNDSSNDPYVSFGMHIAAELRKYDGTMFTRVKHSINTILYEADMELLNQ